MFVHIYIRIFIHLPVTSQLPQYPAFSMRQIGISDMWRVCIYTSTHIEYKYIHVSLYIYTVPVAS
jgi:hypothetical protein